ncbi:MAG: hypothetical protein AB8B96_08010 [Lysobacterales bacterium]
MPNYIKPTGEQINDMLAMFVPGSVQTTESDAGAADLSHAAVYCDPEGNVVGTCACDFQLAAGLGASLSMVPPGAVEDMMSSGTLSDIVNDNLYEVMNMFSSLFMSDHSPHLKLTDVVAYGDLPSEAGDGRFESSWFELVAGNYGKGKIQFSAI